MALFRRSCRVLHFSDLSLPRKFSSPFFPLSSNSSSPLSLCLIPFFSQYHLNDSCKPLRIFSCKWWGFFSQRGEKGDSLSGDIHLISHSAFSFLSFSHSLSPSLSSITLQFNCHNKYERGFIRGCENPDQWIYTNPGDYLL